MNRQGFHNAVYNEARRALIEQDGKGDGDSDDAMCALYTDAAQIIAVYATRLHYTEVETPPTGETEVHAAWREALHALDAVVLDMICSSTEADRKEQECYRQEHPLQGEDEMDRTVF